ncbi:H-2 class II histocompatibility antigen, E-S beta chain-like [Seriola lalandi dorsalis]|uniref:H-2 class II histocompatibility antigen, E-S beta chain-like n=1 Tax=Seriola lalandi dorsalis TaxID=1841481 RepID=A0A3B4X7J5_SERLL|nr:H-2 class II histocompatibility antigen, E-S beta chain-like [Seriola lalandi dorsalis]XP_056237872.1 H-2 class II histocompatibility antigen, E-S beta chain-like isoform X1 [Seriola aureovittata]
MMGLYFLYNLAVSAVLLCTTPADGYVYQMMYDCEYGDNITDMVFIVKNIFNQKLNNIYDSRVGKYVGFGEYGMKNADHYNNQAWKMALRKTQVETLCRYNARLFRRSTLDRKVPPIVRVHQTKLTNYGERSMLECSVVGFFPQEVRVSWLRDGVEVSTDVSSTDVLPNEDWSFQLHSYLELTPKRGERVSCRVDHSSLKESLEVAWDTFALDAKHVKMTAGIIFFFIGLTAAAGGAVYHWWKQRFDFSPVGRQG